jgi:hypothetical protein
MVYSFDRKNSLAVGNVALLIDGEEDLPLVQARGKHIAEELTGIKILVGSPLAGASYGALLAR